MITQVSFTTEKSLKEKVLKKAKQEGITLKAILTYAMRGYADGKISLGIRVLEPDVEPIYFDNEQIKEEAKKLALALKNRKKHGAPHKLSRPS